MADRRTALLILIISIALIIPAQQPGGSYLKWYAEAERLYALDNGTEITDSLALNNYLKVVSYLENGKGSDSILWDARYKAAILHQSFNQFEAAIPLLRNCVELQDSLATRMGANLFLPSLYLGNSYYTINRFDSARHYYGKAERIAQQYDIQQGLERLYNAFGVMNFETGNYRQSRNNFEKAISLLEKQPNPPAVFLVNYKGNLASALRKLYDFDGAMAIYRSLLPYNINTDQLNHNIASVYLSIGASPQAIQYLHKTREQSVAKWNDLGNAHLNLEQYDSAAFYLNKAAQQINTENRKDIFAALSHKYRGDLYAAQQQWMPALQEYQRTILLIHSNFTDSSITSNPDNYSGVFGVIELYETLLAKANAFRALYKKEQQSEQLEYALQTFRSLYKLLDYVEKTYDSDESKIFLNQKKYQSHHIPIDLCLELYEIKKDPSFLEEAFYFDERNKASVLSNVLSEEDLKQHSGLPPELIAEEHNCKEKINRLSLQASNTQDAGSLQQIQTQIREQELLLESISKKLNAFSSYQRLKFADKTVTIKELQDHILPKNGAIISYHKGDTHILSWFITSNSFEYHLIPYNDSLIQQIGQLNGLLQNSAGISNTQLQVYSRPLYRQLVLPWEKKLAGYEQLMIIPDDELNQLPFEMLSNAAGEYLIQSHSVIYNNSCTLLQIPAETKSDQELLGFAPFTEKNVPGALPPLPGSAQELTDQKGLILMGASASKSNFLKEAGRYPILHLATHAQTNDEDPLKSFIAFYPAHPDSSTLDQIHLPDIYSLSLKNSRLAILSACETGSGQLIRGEGIISLSRAFSYAGCPNMIMSQWKANDQSTAYILKRLHHYLRSGKSIAHSLREAKLDYLKDASIEGRYKAAGYWAHLRYTGQFEVEKTGSLLWWLVLIVPIGLIFFFRQKKSGPKGTGGIS